MNGMVLEINGKPYSGFSSATASKSMTDICGTFSFSVSALDSLQKFPIKNESECRVLVNDLPFITGFVETIGIDYSATGHQINIGGRDKTCDVVDSTLGKETSFSAGISLQAITEKILDQLGLKDKIKVTTNVDDLKVFDKSELNNISAQIGETAFNFIEKYAKKRQVLVMSDGNGNIVLARTPKDTARINTIINSDFGFQGIALNATATYDNTKRFYKYVLSSQSNSVSSGLVEDVNQVDNNTIVSVGATAYDEEMRHSRIFNLVQHDDSYNSKSDLQDRATWEANYRRATGFKYSVSVQGFTPENDPGTIWMPNMLVMVNDAYCDIGSQLLLVKSVAFSYSVDSGSMTTLELVDKNGYSVEILQGIKYKKYKQAKPSGSNVNGGAISDLRPYGGTN